MFTLNCKGRLLKLDKPLIMGIINITPDSFYEDSRFKTNELILAQVKKMLEEGADIIDIGGQSTRPGSERISIEQELQRVLPAVESIIKEFPSAVISVDTYQSQVATVCINAGASIINDISAGNMDAEMIPSVAKLNVPYICMHMQGTPQTMHKNPRYENVTQEVLDFFIKKIYECKGAGILDVIIDPGFGFGKTIAHNFRLLKEMEVLKMLNKAILVGLSRKSTVYKTLGVTPNDALNGTTVLQTLALYKGANILRVHDVKEAKETILLYEQYKIA